MVIDAAKIARGLVGALCLSLVIIAFAKLPEALAENPYVVMLGLVIGLVVWYPLVVTLRWARRQDAKSSLHVTWKARR